MLVAGFVAGPLKSGWQLMAMMCSPAKPVNGYTIPRAGPVTPAVTENLSAA